MNKKKNHYFNWTKKRVEEYSDQNKKQNRIVSNKKSKKDAEMENKRNFFKSNRMQELQREILSKKDINHQNSISTSHDLEKLIQLNEKCNQNKEKENPLQHSPSFLQPEKIPAFPKKKDNRKKESDTFSKHDSSLERSNHIVLFIEFSFFLNFNIIYFLNIFLYIYFF